MKTKFCWVHPCLVRTVINALASPPLFSPKVVKRDFLFSLCHASVEGVSASSLGSQGLEASDQYIA